MTRLTIAFALLLCAVFAARAAEKTTADSKTASAEDRLLLPHNFVRGYVDFEVAPPHNEVDLGLCLPHPGPLVPGAVNCAAYARYVWSGYVEFQPFGRTPLKHVFLFATPKFFAGDNVPGLQYTASHSGILWEETLGGGVTLPYQFEFRMTHHRTHLLGRYRGMDNPLVLQPDGPYGLYTTLGLRWSFGGYGRSSAH